MLSRVFRDATRSESLRFLEWTCHSDTKTAFSLGDPHRAVRNGHVHLLKWISKHDPELREVDEAATRALPRLLEELKLPRQATPTDEPEAIAEHEYEDENKPEMKRCKVAAP